MKTLGYKFLVSGALLCLAWAGGVAAQDTAPPPPPAAAQDLADEPPVPEGADSLRFNFQGVPVNTVLDYMSKAAGFIIDRQADTSGTVDVLSHQTLNKDEAVELLNTILYDKGLAAVRNDRILRIVTIDEAQKNSPLPVVLGSDPNDIPTSMARVTQIMHLRYASAPQIIQELSPLIPTGMIVAANTSSNAIMLTDSQINIRRIAEIIQALDTTVLETSTVRIYKLDQADATEMANLINQVFAAQASANRPPSSAGSGSNADRIAEFISRMRSGGGPPGGGFPGGFGGGGR